MGGVSALPGVAVAVALMPPLCAVGFGIGAGFQRNIISGASLLFVTNLAAIMTAAVLVFSVIRMEGLDIRHHLNDRPPDAGDKPAALRHPTWLSSAAAVMGKFQWRMLMLLTVLGILFVPLRKGLVEVRDEAVARSAIREAIGRVVRPTDVLSQQVELTGERIRVWLVLDQPLSPGKIAEARQWIIKKTGKDADVIVRKVASEQELALLREQLRPPPRPPMPVTLESIRADVLPRLEKPLNELWPSTEAKLVDYELGFDREGSVVHIRYEAKRPLDPTAAEMIQRYLQAQLGVEKLRVELSKIAPPPATRAKAAARKPQSARR